VARRRGPDLAVAARLRRVADGFRQVVGGFSASHTADKRLERTIQAKPDDLTVPMGSRAAPLETVHSSYGPPSYRPGSLLSEVTRVGVARKVSSEMYSCSGCGQVFDASEQVGAKTALGLLGLATGGRIGKHPVAALVVGLLGVAVGHYFDTQFVRCPTCQKFVRVINAVEPWPAV
jgi:hypothetical protein